MQRAIKKFKYFFNKGILLLEVYMQDDLEENSGIKPEEKKEYKVPNGGHRVPYYRYYLINHKDKNLLYMDDNLDQIKRMFNIFGANPIYFTVRVEACTGSVEILENGEFKNDELFKLIYGKTMFFIDSVKCDNQKLNDLNDLFLSLGKKKNL